MGSNQNYGVVAGIGGLIIFDADGLMRLTELGIMDALPATFSVRTGGGGVHKYYLSDLDKKIIMFDRTLKEEDKPLHLGEVQSRGFQAVGPGSIHPNGNRYEVIDDLPIANLAAVDLIEILNKRVDFGFEEAAKEKKRLRVVAVNPNIKDPFDGVRVENVLSPRGNVRKLPTGLKGAHPVHGSSSGNNFEVDFRENTWRCWRCFPSGTLVNTPDGLRDIKDITPDDEVLSREGKSQKVITTFRRCYGGQLYKISSSVAPVEATRGHQILVMRCHGCPKSYESYKACVPNCPRKNGNCAQHKSPEEAWVKVENINPETDFLILPKSKLVNDSFFGKDITQDSYKNRSRNGNGWFDENHWYVPIDKIETSEFVGQVYNLNTEDNTYQVPFVVHNCGSGGGVALAIAVREGIIRCDQARAGVLRGDLFKQTVDAARERKYISEKPANCRVEKV